MPQKQTVCAWCGSTVKISQKGNLMPHLTPGQTRCVGGGQDAAASDRIRTARAERWT